MYSAWHKIINTMFISFSVYMNNANKNFKNKTGMWKARGSV